MKRNLITVFLAAFFVPLGLIKEQRNPVFFAVAAVAGPASHNQRPDSLLEMTRSSDAAVRHAAVRSLRNHLPDHRVKGRILEMASDPKESIEVRRECIKALTYLTTDRDAANKIKEAAFDSNWPRPLKVLGFKALYHIVVLDSGTRRDLLNAANRGDDLELRQAAIWGLHEASRQHNEVKKELLNMAERETLPVRIAALKSLYLAMTHLDVKDRIFALAKDRRQDAALRYGAVLALSAVNSDLNVRKELEAFSKDRDLQIQRAAALAMGDAGNTEILVYFHFAYRRGSSGPFIDPLDAE